MDSVYSRSSPNLSQHSGGQTAAESTAGRNNAANLPVGASAHSLTNNQVGINALRKSLFQHRVVQKVYIFQSQSRRSSLISTASFEQVAQENFSSNDQKFILEKPKISFFF